MATFISIRHGFSLGLVLAFVSSIVLVIHALTNDVNVKSGVVTIQFNRSELAREFTRDIVNGILPKRAPLGLEDILQHIPSNISDFIPDQIQGTFNGISQDVDSVENTVKALLPNNCSIGTRKFCIGFDSNESCRNLPINLTSIFPPEAVNLIQGKFGGISAIDGALEKATAPYVQNTLIAGSVTTFIVDTFFISSIYGLQIPLIGGLGWGLQLAIYLIIGQIFCIPFVISTIIFHVLRSNLGSLPTWIQLQEGNVYGLCVGCFCCSAIAVVLGSVGRILSSTTITSSKNHLV